MRLTVPNASQVVRNAQLAAWALSYKQSCEECDGKGEYLDAPSDVLNGRTYYTTCHACNGSGIMSHCAGMNLATYAGARNR